MSSICDRPPAVGQVAEAVLPEGQRPRTLRSGSRAIKLASQLAVEQRIGLLRVLEQVGQVEHGEFLDQTHQQRRSHSVMSMDAARIADNVCGSPPSAPPGRG